MLISAGVAHADLLLAQAQLHLGRQLQQAQVVADGGAVLAHLGAQLLLGQLHLLDQPLEADGHLDGVEPSRWMFSTSAISSMASSWPRGCRRSAQPRELAGPEAAFAMISW